MSMCGMGKKKKYSVVRTGLAAGGDRYCSAWN